MNPRQTVTQIKFTSEFDLTKDLAITIDYSTSIAFLTPSGRGNWPSGGVLIGLYDTSYPLSGTFGTRGLGYGPEADGSTTGITNGILGIGFDFIGNFYYNSLSSMNTNLSADYIAGSVQQLGINTITVVGPTVSAFNYIGTSTGAFFDPVEQSVEVTLSDVRQKRLRVRLTDFGNTVFVDYFNFNKQQFVNAYTTTWVNSFNKAGVYIAYTCDYNDQQELFITNINLNGMFTNTYITSSTHIPAY